MNRKVRNVLIVLILAIVALVSISKIAPIASDPDYHEYVTERIDDKISSVLLLAAGATGASAAISLLPDDTCTPIAEEFAQLDEYFLVVLCLLYLEKYMVTLTGFAAFGIMIPIGCVLLGVGILSRRPNFRTFSYKLVLASLALYFLIPASVRVSDVIYKNYEKTIESTIADAERIVVDDKDATAWEKFAGWVENAAGNLVDYVTGLLSRFIEAIAVMVVTSCLIPILVFVFALWLLKFLFKIEIPFKMPMPGRKRGLGRAIETASIAEEGMKE